ncbi:hypothetical protein ACOMHN_061144 [Nucella lapillus]
MKVPVSVVSLRVTLLVILSLSWTQSASVVPRNNQPDNSLKCRNRFGYRYYYDHGTEHCEQCREICQNAQIMGTVQQCGTECQQYLTAMKCADKEDEYYDEMLDTCSPCASLCDNHQATGNTRTCREYCSAYLDKLTPKEVPSHHKQNYLKAMDGSDAEETSQKSDLILHPGWIASIAVGGVALLCLVVVVVVLYWTFRQQQQQQYGLAPQQDEEKERRTAAQQRPPPVEETNQGSEDSVHFAIDAASGLPPTAVAFADLQDDETRVNRV